MPLLPEKRPLLECSGSSCELFYEGLWDLLLTLPRTVNVSNEDILSLTTNMASIVMQSLASSGSLRLSRSHIPIRNPFHILPGPFGTLSRTVPSLPTFCRRFHSDPQARKIKQRYHGYRACFRLETQAASSRLVFVCLHSLYHSCVILR